MRSFFDVSHKKKFCFTFVFWFHLFIFCFFYPSPEKYDLFKVPYFIPKWMNLCKIFHHQCQVILDLLKTKYKLTSLNMTLGKLFFFSLFQYWQKKNYLEKSHAN
jgi:hypothetical protein